MKKFIHRAVYDQFFWEIYFPDQGERISEISDMGAAVAVAGKEYRIAVFPAKFQYGPVIFLCFFMLPTVTAGSQGTIVDFQKNMAVHGGFHKTVVVYRVFDIVRMGFP